MLMILSLDSDRELHNHRSNGQSNQTHDLMKSPITSYERNQSLDDQAISVDKNEDHPMPGIHVIRYQIRNPHQPRIRLVEDKDPNPVTVSGPKHRMTSLKPQLSDSQSDQRRIFRIPRMEQKPFTPSHHLDFSRDENEGDSTSISRRETPVSSPNVQFNEAQSDDTGMRRITYEDMAAPFPRQRAKENGKTNFIDYVFQSGPDEMEYAEAWQAFRAQGKSDNVVRRLWRIEREPAVRDMASASQTEVAGHISFSANNEQGDLTAKWVKQPSVIKPNNMVDTTVGGEDEDDESKLADDFGAYSFPEQIETADPQQRYNMQRLAIANGIFHSADQDMLLKTVQRLLSVTKDPSPPLPSLEEKDKEKEKEGEKG